MTDLNAINPVDESNHMAKPDQIPMVIPCGVNEFGNFIMGLLSKPQHLKGEEEGIFEIGIKDIGNVFHLIDQRIKKQNGGSLVNFEIKVIYDNGTSISHKQVADFESYYPTENAKPIEAILSFNYLIKFNDKKVPEKQEITFIFSAEPNKSPERQKWYACGLIQWEILHSERTWAADINGLLKNHAANCMSKKSQLWSWFIRNYEEIQYYLGALIICTVVCLWASSTFAYLKSLPEIYSLFRYYTGSVAIFITMVFLINITVRVVSLRLVVKKESYICLIDKDFTDRDKQKSKSTFRVFIYAATVIINIGIGVVSNIVYNSNWLKGIL